jgi:hypothetical protein
MKAERSMVYHGLKHHTQVSTRLEYYEKFGIDPDSKRKKKKVGCC